MQLGMKVVANLAPGLAAVQAPYITSGVRRDIMKRTLELGGQMGPSVGAITVDLDSMVLVNLRVTMPNREIYRSNGVIVPFAVEGADGVAGRQEFAALYHLKLDRGEHWHNLFGPADGLDRSVRLLAWQRMQHTH